MFSKILSVCFLTFAFCLLGFAQTLTVRDIMAEPSLAGMRPDSERLAPDGSLVVFSWNAGGKEPGNLYLVSTNDNGQPQMIVDAEKNYEQRTEQPESKLNYGLIVRDDFVKAREKNLSGAEFSPNSKRLLFTQNGDIYVLDLSSASNSDNPALDSKFRNLTANLERYADLIPNFVKALQMKSIQEQEVFGQLADARSKFLNAAMQADSTAGRTISATQKQFVLKTFEALKGAMSKILALQENYPQLRSDELFQKLQDELTGVENRIRLARSDYNETNQSYKPRRITRTQGAEVAARWLDDSTILFQSNGNFYAIDIEQTALVQLTKEANPAAFVFVSSVTPTENGKFVAYIVADNSRQRTLYVPNYLNEFVQTPSVRRGFSEQKIYATETDGSREKPFEVKLPKAEGASYVRTIKWAADNRSLLVDRIDKDTKRRQLFYVFNVGGKDEKLFLLTEETDEKWIGGLSRIVEPNPKDAGKILFASERDGWNHLYLATLDPAKFAANPNNEQRQENSSNAGYAGNFSLKQLTKGNYEVDWAKWRAKGDEIVFSSTEANTAEREFYLYNLQNNSKLMLPSAEKGIKNQAQLSSKGSNDYLLYQYSNWKQPADLYAQRICPDCSGSLLARRLTVSVPENFTKMKWNAPQFISFKAKDGKTIPAKIYLPENFDKAKKYPMVMFVHGAGYLQNVINGWNNYYREFMFNELLTQKGYVVMDIDYRGSAGYGRDFRTDVYDFLGGLDYQDHLDAIDYAVQNYSVNPSKIGAYGGSYGGFMAEMLVFRAPEKIAAAAALRPVADWKNYFASSPVYTAERLGFPDKNPEGYKRSSPISYADGLRRPLLILHGMVDDNVPAQDSVQLTEKLIRLEKTPYFETMFYPAENHGFTRPTSWTDEYTRILNFFEKHLR